MTERDTASLLHAALQSRAEYGMQTTNTDRELDRLRGQMAPVRRRRRLQLALATAAALAVVGGAVGLGLALSSADRDKAKVIAPQPTSTTLPPGTLPAGFPIGTWSHPGGAGLMTLKVTRHAVAFVSGPDGTGRNVLTFATPDVVIFDVTNTVDCRTPGRYRWSVSSSQLRFTAVSDTCSPRRIGLTELPWGPVRKTQSP